MPQNYDACSPQATPPTQFVNNTNAGTPVLGYAIGFPYLAATDIVVFTGDTGNWTLRNQGTGANEYAVNPQNGLGTDQVVFTGGTPGANILIIRRTDLCEAARVFQAGASIRAEDLNTDMNQLRFLVQELYSWLEAFAGQEGNEIIPGQNPDLGDLGDVNLSGDNPGWLRWNGTEWQDQPILEDGDAWVADDNHVVTSAAGDDRWLTTGGGSGGTIAAGDGIDITTVGTTNTINVDLAGTSGLEFNSAELRIDVNDGCEIVAAGLNAETTDASIVQTGGDNEDPAIRVTTTLGTAVTNTDLQVSGGANITVTRNSNTQMTIAAPALTGGATFRGTVDVDNNNTLPATAGQQNPNAVVAGDAFTVENNVAAADVTANWNTVLDNWDVADGMINSGDVIICTTPAAVGSPTDARYNLIRTGGNINTLQQVTTAGNTTTNVIEGPNGTEGAPSYTFDGDENTGIFRPAADTVGVAVNAQERFRVEAAGIRVLDDAGTALHQINANASAVFNETGADADFRVESDGNANMLFVDGGNNRVGIGTAAPAQTLHVGGRTQFDDQFTVRTGNNAVFNNAGNTQSISINADDATATYNLTLPPTGPTAANRFLRAAGVGTGAAQELEWAAGGGGGGALDVQDDGTAVIAGATTLNFTGNGVTVTDGGNDTADIDIPFVGAAAWGKVARDGSLTAGLNIDSSAPNGQGRYDIVFANAMPSADYAVTLGFDETNGDGVALKAENQTANGFSVFCFDNPAGAGVVNSAFSFAVHALNALPPRGGTGTDAWAQFNGNGGAVIAASFNVESITRTAEGTYNVVFVNPMPSAAYAVSGCNSVQALSRTTNGFTLQNLSTADGNVGDSSEISFAVNATNATLPLTITEDQIAALIQNPVLSAWGDINGDGTIDSSFNLTVTKNPGQGSYVISFVNPLPNATYSVTTGATTSNARPPAYANQTANGFTVVTTDSAGVPTDQNFSVQVAGTARNGTLGGGADAWGNVAANGTLNGGLNATVTRSATGTYDVVFENAMPNANYSVLVSCSAFTGIVSTGQTANGFTYITRDRNNTAEDSVSSFAVFATDGNAGGFWTRTGQGATEVLSPLNDDADVRVGGNAAPNAVIDSDGTFTSNRSNAADACFVAQDDGTTNATVFANGSIDCSGIVIGASGMTLNGVPTRNAWAANEIIQTQVFTDPGTGDFSNTAIGTVQDTQFNFTPRSTNSRVVFEYWFSSRTNNVDATNTASVYRIRTSYGNGTELVSSSFSANGNDGIDAPLSMMVWFANTATDQVFGILDGRVTGAGASARCQTITCKITEIQQ